MPLPIEDYALIGNTRTAALVGRDGSIDWFCLPRFDSQACFAALLGEPGHGRWLLAPADGAVQSHRRYRGDTLILETEFRTGAGRVRVTDCTPVEHAQCHLVRIVEGMAGEVGMRMELIIRFEYGSVVPWVRRSGDKLIATAGRKAEAEALFGRLLSLRNDVGLVSEEYDPRGGRMLGNFPQAMTHVALVNTARNLAGPGGPGEHRGQRERAAP